MKDQTKFQPLKGHVNKNSSLICERQDEKQLTKPFGSAFMILQSLNLEGLISLAFLSQVCFVLQAFECICLTFFFSSGIFQKHINKVVFFFPQREIERIFFFFFFFLRYLCFICQIWWLYELLASNHNEIKCFKAVSRCWAEGVQNIVHV